MKNIVLALGVQPCVAATVWISFWSCPSERQFCKATSWKESWPG